MPSDATAIVIASISGAVSIAAASIAALQARKLERFRDSLSRAREAESRAEQAKRVVSKYRDPLLQSAFDLQSRIYNIYRIGGFRGRADPEYFRLNTLFVLAEFLGWGEIMRREVQFLDLSAVDATNELGSKLDRVYDRLASTSKSRDDLFIFRGHQRAIGELMMTRVRGKTQSDRQLECMGYAAFVQAQARPEFARWFERLGNAISRLPDTQEKPLRLVEVQHALIDLIDLLDRDCIRFQASRRGRLGAPEAAKLVLDSAQVGPGEALNNEALAIQAAVNHGDPATACANIANYKSLVETQPGETLTTGPHGTATMLIMDVKNLTAVLGCSIGETCLSGPDPWNDPPA